MVRSEAAPEERHFAEPFLEQPFPNAPCCLQKMTGQRIARQPLTPNSNPEPPHSPAPAPTLRTGGLAPTPTGLGIFRLQEQQTELTTALGTESS